MRNRHQGFTLIEIIFVITIIVITFSVALPNFALLTGTKVQETLGQLSADVRSAYDMAVLHRKPHRLVFMMATGDYWLEVADREKVFIADDKAKRDLSQEEEKDQRDAFEQLFEEYKTLAGQEYRDSDSYKVIKAFSPVLEAKADLMPPEWTRVENTEWRRRTIGPDLLFKLIKAEHHEREQTLANLGEEARAVVYFFPAGYAEPTVMHIAFRADGLEIDTTQEPYTLIINPYDGTASLENGERIPEELGGS